MSSDRIKNWWFRSWAIKLCVLGVVVVLLGVAGFIWLKQRGVRAEAEVAKAVTELRASGVAVDDRTLAEFHRSVTDDRRTDQWVRVLEQLHSLGEDLPSRNMPIVGSEGMAHDVPLPGEPWDDRREVQAFLHSQQALLAELHDVASEPTAVWFPISFNSVASENPFIFASRSAARLLHLEHHAAVYAGHRERAAQSIRSIIGVSESLSGEPLMTSQLTRIAIYHTAILALQRSLEQDVLDEESLVDVLTWLDFGDDFQTPYRIALTGERAAHVVFFLEPERFDFFEPSPINYLARGALGVLDFYERGERLAEEENAEAFFLAVERLRHEVEAEIRNAWLFQKLDLIGIIYVTPVYAAFTDALARQIMSNRLARLAVGLRLYQRRFGVWPEELDDLTAVGLDPNALVALGGGPFGYRLEGAEAVLWGVEPGGADELDSLWREVPDSPPPLDDSDSQHDSRWVWRLSAGQ